jgi:mono/diheme cytochrome c family protein
VDVQEVAAVRVPVHSIPLAFALAACNLYWSPPEPAPGPPISGGTLLVTADGRRAVAADPVRDKIFFVDLESRTLGELALQPGDEPGRVVEDPRGRVHVALRRGGAVVTLEGRDVVARREVCSAPRGLAYDANSDLIHVACAGGELVSLPAAGGDPVRRLRLEPDLRDVVVDGGELLVSRFRSAELVRVGADGAVASRAVPRTTRRLRFVFDELDELQSVPVVPAVAWRTIATADGRALMVHQRAVQGELSTSPGGYGGDCDGPVETSVTFFDPGDPVVRGNRRLGFAVLPVDVAMSPDGRRLAIALAGTGTVRSVDVATLALADDEQPEEPCNGTGGDFDHFVHEDWHGSPVAVAYDGTERLVIQLDNAIVIDDVRTASRQATLPLPDSRVDAGRRRFHRPTFSGLACASCHPEGREDGLVWTFDSLGPRRTQNVGGDLADRAPYHWGGDMRDLPTLINEVLIGRMGGEFMDDREISALERFLFSLPPAPTSPPEDASAVERGRRLFESSTVGCARCHSGPLYTDNTMADVGTGTVLKVPSLIGIAARAPYLHDGCAATLRDRFGPCGGDAHGATDLLSADQLSDLIAFLESL